MDWQSYVFDPAENWVARFTALARSRFPRSEALAEEAVTDALSALSEDGWARLSDFKGDAQPGTYLTSVYLRLIEDFQRKRFGRLRPPKAVVQASRLHVDVWRWVFMQRLDREAVIDQLVSGFDLNRTSAIGIIREVVRWTGTKARAGTDPIEVDLPDYALDAELTEDEDGVSEGLLEAVSSLLQSVEVGEESSMGLTEDDALMLKLIYADGLSVSAAARVTGEADHSFRRRHKRLLKTLKTWLADFGQSEPLSDATGI